MDKKKKMSKLNALVSTYKRQSKKDGKEVNIGFADSMNVGVSKFYKFNIKRLDSLTGGVPCGQFTVIAGPQQSGKSTLVARLVADVQKEGGVAGWVDAEHQLDREWLRTQGVNTEELFVVDDSFLEPALDNVRGLLKDGVLDLMVVDSITALGSLKELKDKKKGLRSMEDDTIAIQARKISQFFRMSVGLTKRANCAIVLIAQVRCSITLFGGLEMIPGGKALEHYCSLRLKTRRGGKRYDIIKKVKGKEKKLGFSCIMKLDKKRSTKAMVEGTEIAVPFLFATGPTNDVKAIKEEEPEW